MSPKIAQPLIRLSAIGQGLVHHYLWEKEVLIDYLASCIYRVREPLLEYAKESGISVLRDYEEFCEIATAIQRRPAVGLNEKIQFDEVFDDLRDFVAWDKEELGDYLLHQFVALGVAQLMEYSHCKRFADELSDMVNDVMASQDDGSGEKADQAYRLNRNMTQARADYRRASDLQKGTRLAESVAEPQRTEATQQPTVHKVA